MSDDIVTRLRHTAWLSPEGEPAADLMTEAADEIERLRAAGDALADELGRLYAPNAGDVIALWTEARRG